MASDKSVIRSVRLGPGTDKIITAIAAFEDRTVSKVLARLIDYGLKDYMKIYAANDTDESERFYNFISQVLDKIEAEDKLKSNLYDVDVNEMITT